MSRDLKILQANLGKRCAAQTSLLNDEALREYSFLLIQEPHFYTAATTGGARAPTQHTYWTATLPSQMAPDSTPFRSMIWVAKGLRTKAVPIASSDITAITYETDSCIVLIASVYIPRTERAGHRTELQSRLQLLQDAIATARQKRNDKELELVIAGDFNRHDQLWGGEAVRDARRQGEAEPIIDFAYQLDLASLLPRGTITFPAGQSTIDLVLATRGLQGKLARCDIYATEHGSDHRAIDTAFSLAMPTPTTQPKQMFKDAPWQEIREKVAYQIAAQETPENENDVESILRRMMNIVTTVVEEKVPKSKPSRYTKPWWTKELTSLRKTYTTLRNRATATGRAGIENKNIHEQAKTALHQFRSAIRAAKRSHWKSFLDEQTNVWKAARYRDQARASGFAKIASIVAPDGSMLEEDDEIGAELLRSFFPEVPEIVGQEQNMGDQQRPEQLEMEPLTVGEVEDAIFKARPHKAPGADGLPAIVWQELWPVLKWEILILFMASMRQRHFPQSWRIAKIIPLRKPGKSDYSQAKSYRPISLLATLGKVLESVVATRIAYLAEKHSLLPQNHFGARRRRSTDQALLILTERIFEAWRRKKVLSLISFDVKGAYNGVDKNTLLNCLRRRRVPEKLVQWIDSFCSARQASITVNTHTTETHPLRQAGLPQGSNLSPVLYTFFNADLVQTPINGNQGAIAFVDDYTAWVVGDMAEQNTRAIQSQIVPAALRWATASGASFEPGKTAFVHFTRFSSKLDSQALHINGQTVAPTELIKILGVTLDRQLLFDQHISQVAKKGLRATLALKRLTGLRPKAYRQLLTATVMPVVDYASPIWSIMASQKSLSKLNQQHRLGAQAVVGCFRTVAGATAEMEAGVDPLQTRLKKKRLQFWLNLHTLPKSHPFWACQRVVSRRYRSTRYPSALSRMNEEFKHVVVTHLETIEPFGRPPWAPSPPVIIEDEESAIDAFLENDSPQYRLFADGSTRNGLVGMGSYSADGAFSKSVTIGATSDLDIHYAELMAIKTLLDTIKRASMRMTNIIAITIYTDSQTALRRLLKAKAKSGQHIINNILESIETLHKDRRVQVTLRWIPGHKGVDGNEAAHNEARRATEEGRRIATPQHPRLKSVALQLAKRRIDSESSSAPPKTGIFTRQLDGALPSKHMRKIYDSLGYKEAGILAQLRSGMCRLNAYLAKIKAVESADCSTCGVPETVQHFLLQCKIWTSQRQELVETVKDRVNDLSYLLGGYSSVRDQKGNYVDGDVRKWKPNAKVVTATINFVKNTKRFDPIETEVSN